MQNRIPDSEIKRAQEERQRLAEIEQPKLDPARDCGRCFGINLEQRKDEEGYITVVPCDHQPVPF